MCFNKFDNLYIYIIFIFFFRIIFYLKYYINFDTFIYLLYNFNIFIYLYHIFTIFNHIVFSITIFIVKIFILGAKLCDCKNLIIDKIIKGYSL